MFSTLSLLLQIQLCCSGASGSNAYIACQGPLPHTVNDFWRMVVECEVQVRTVRRRAPKKVKCCGSGIPDPNVSVPDPGSKRFQILDPDPHQRIYVFLTIKTVPLLSEDYLWCSCRIPDPDCFPSRIHGLIKHRIWIRNIGKQINWLSFVYGRFFNWRAWGFFWNLIPRVGIVPDPCHFDTDPDPWFRTLDFRIQIQTMHALFVSDFQDANKNKFFSNFLLITLCMYIYSISLQRRKVIWSHLTIEIKIFTKKFAFCWKDPDSYKIIVDPEPAGPKTYGSGAPIVG